MKKDKIKAFFNSRWARAGLVLFGIGLVFLLWYLIALAITHNLAKDDVNNIFFPGPEVVMPLFFRMLGEVDTYVNIGYTLLRMIISFLVCFLVAFIVGLIAGLCKPLQKVLKPLIIVIRTIPTAALILSFIVFLRYQYSLFIIVFLVMFPILYEAVVSGINHVDHYIIQALRVDCGLYRPKAVFNVIIPSASPYIFLGIIQTLGLGLKVSIMAEVMLSISNVKGIGVAFYIATTTLDYDLIFAYSLYAILIIGTLDLILHFIKKTIKNV